MEIRVTTGAIDEHQLGEIADYPDDVAMRLVSRGFAEPVGGMLPEEPEKAGEAESANIEDMKLDELKERCREMGLPTSGKKGDLVARIQEAEAVEDGETDDDDEPPSLNAEVPQ